MRNTDWARRDRTRFEEKKLINYFRQSKKFRPSPVGVTFLQFGTLSALLVKSCDLFKLTYYDRNPHVKIVIRIIITKQIPSPPRAEK